MTAQEQFEAKRHEWFEARQVMSDAKLAVGVMREAMIRDVLNKIELFLSGTPEAAAVKSAEALYAEVGREMRQLEDAAALDQQFPYPLGTVMAKWERQRNYTVSDRDPYHFVPTKDRGILEVITSASAHPDNVIYGRASIGSTVVRSIDKNGKPGKRYLEFGTGDDRKKKIWRPEGFDPNAAAKDVASKAQQAIIDAARAEQEALAASALAALYGESK